MEYVGATDAVDWIHYDGWGMLTPEGPWKFGLGACVPLAKTGLDIPGLVLRDDDWQLLPLLLKFPGAVLPALQDAATLNEPFSNVLDRLEREDKLRPNSWLRTWLDALAFSLSGLDCSGTTTAAMAFTVDELHRQDTRGLAYPKGGMGSVIDALVGAVEKYGGIVRTGVKVREVML